MTVRIDSHQHFWTLQRNDYGWLTPDLTPLYRDFLPADLAPLLAETGIALSVLVQAAPSVAETRFLLNLAERHDFVAGVVGWVDVDDRESAARDVENLAKHPSFVGIRPMIQDIADPAWMLAPALAATLEAAIESDICFDALVKPVHLSYLLELLHRHPNLRAVLDHGAKPNIAGGEWQPWADAIARTAAETDAYCKLSGLITEASDTHTYEAVVPYMDHLLKCFGPRRLMWGSDWPVLNLADRYVGWHRATQRWLSPLAAAHREAIEGGNAARFYGLAADN